MAAMDELVIWLRRQLDDDEGLARTAFAEHNDAIAEWHEPWSGTVEIGPHEDDLCCNDSGVSRHIVNWDPARILAEVDAKRGILRLYEKALASHRAGSVSPRNRAQDEAAVDVLGVAIRTLALPYADRPGYRERWRP